MGLRHEFRVLHQTSDFDSFQMLPRSILSLGMTAWAGVLDAHLYSFPRLIRDHRFGVVVARNAIRYHKPYDFFSGEYFDVAIEVCPTLDRKHFVLEIEFKDAGTEPFASLEIIARAVTTEPGSWGATPGTIEPPILDFFEEKDFYPERLGRPVEALLKTFRKCEPIARNTLEKRIHRHECEAADQWSFIEIGTHAANAREELLLAHPIQEDSDAQIKALLNRPLERIQTLIKRPLFLFDPYTIQSDLYHKEDGYHVVHRYRSNVGRPREHAVVIESYTHP